MFPFDTLSYDWMPSFKVGILLHCEIGGGDSINCQSIRKELALQIYQNSI